MAVVKIDLDVDPTTGEAKIRLIGGKLGELEEKGKKTKSALGGIMEGLQVGAGVAAMERLFGMFERGIGAIMGSVRAQDAYVSGILKVTAATDLSARSQAILMRAGKDADVSFEKQIAGLGKLAKVLDEHPEKLGRLGLSYDKIKGLAPEAQFEAIGSKIAGIEDPMKRLAVAQEFFGKSGAELIPLFSGALGDARDAVDRLGLSISDIDAQNIDALNNSLDMLDEVIDAAVRQFVAMIASSEPVHAFVTGLTEAVASLSKAFFGNKDASRSLVDEGVLLLAKGLVTLVDAAQLTVDVWDSLRLAGRAFYTVVIDLALATTKLALAYSYIIPGGNLIRDALRENIALMQAEKAAQTAAAEEILESNRKKTNAISIVRAEMVKLEKAVESSMGKTHASAEADKKKTATLVGLGGAALKAASDLKTLEEEMGQVEAKAFDDMMKRNTDAMIKAWGKSRREALLREMSTLPDLLLGVKDRSDLSLAGADPFGNDGVSKYVLGVDHATKATHDWAGALRDIASLFQTLGFSGSSAIVSITTQIAGALAATQRLQSILFTTDKDGKKTRKSWGGLSPEDKMEVGLAGLQTGVAAYQSGSVLGGAAGGAAFGSAFGPWGAAIGGAVGGLLGLFGKGAKQKQQRAEAESNAIGQLDALVKRWEAFKTEQLEKGVAGVTNVMTYLAGKTDVSADRLERMGRLGYGVFQMLRASGLSMVEAMEKMGPMFDKALAGGAERFGAAFAELAAFRQKILDNADLVSAAESLGDVIDALRTFGRLTQESFNDAVGENKSLIDDMLAQGFTLDEALAINAKSLYAIYRAQKDLGLVVDETTQKYLDQAETSGLFENMKDPMEELVEIQKIQLQIMAELVKVMGGTLPESVRKYLAELDKIPATKRTEAEFHTTYTTSGNPPNNPGDPDNTGGPPQNAAGSGGLQNYGGGTLAMLHGEEAVLTRAQINNLIRGASGSAAGVGAGQGVHIGAVHVNVPDGTSDPERFGRRVAEAINRALKNNTAGVRDTVRAEVA